jgi:alkylhydroperoxidase family enzyme
MAWIKTVPMSEADERLRELMTKQRELYPAEYATPVEGTDEAGRTDMPNIVSSHTLIPDALFHAFSTFGSLMSPDLPLTRRQQEMITTTVSVTNRCFY